MTSLHPAKSTFISTLLMITAIIMLFPIITIAADATVNYINLQGTQNGVIFVGEPLQFTNIDSTTTGQALSGSLTYSRRNFNQDGWDYVSAAFPFTFDGSNEFKFLLDNPAALATHDLLLNHPSLPTPYFPLYKHPSIAAVQIKITFKSNDQIPIVYKEIELALVSRCDYLQFISSPSNGQTAPLRQRCSQGSFCNPTPSYLTSAGSNLVVYDHCECNPMYLFAAAETTVSFTYGATCSSSHITLQSSPISVDSWSDLYSTVPQFGAVRAHDGMRLRFYDTSADQIPPPGAIITAATQARIVFTSIENDDNSVVLSDMDANGYFSIPTVAKPAYYHAQLIFFDTNPDNSITSVLSVVNLVPFLLSPYRIHSAMDITVATKTCWSDDIAATTCSSTTVSQCARYSIIAPTESLSTSSTSLPITIRRLSADDTADSNATPLNLVTSVSTVITSNGKKYYTPNQPDDWAQIGTMTILGPSRVKDNTDDKYYYSLQANIPINPTEEGPWTATVLFKTDDEGVNNELNGCLISVGFTIAPVTIDSNPIITPSLDIQFKQGQFGIDGRINNVEEMRAQGSSIVGRYWSIYSTGNIDQRLPLFTKQPGKVSTFGYLANRIPMWNTYPILDDGIATYVIHSTIANTNTATSTTSIISSTFVSSQLSINNRCTTAIRNISPASQVFFTNQRWGFVISGLGFDNIDPQFSLKYSHPSGIGQISLQPLPYSIKANGEFPLYFTAPTEDELPPSTTFLQITIEWRNPYDTNDSKSCTYTISQTIEQPTCASINASMTAKVTSMNTMTLNLRLPKPSTMNGLDLSDFTPTGAILSRNSGMDSFFANTGIKSLQRWDPSAFIFDIELSEGIRNDVSSIVLSYTSHGLECEYYIGAALDWTKPTLCPFFRSDLVTFSIPGSDSPLTSLNMFDTIKTGIVMGFRQDYQPQSAEKSLISFGTVAAETKLIKKSGKTLILPSTSFTIGTPAATFTGTESISFKLDAMFTPPVGDSVQLQTRVFYGGEDCGLKTFTFPPFISTECPISFTAQEQSITFTQADKTSFDLPLQWSSIYTQADWYEFMKIQSIEVTAEKTTDSGQDYQMVVPLWKVGSLSSDGLSIPVTPSFRPGAGFSGKARFTLNYGPCSISKIVVNFSQQDYLMPLSQSLEHTPSSNYPTATLSWSIPQSRIDYYANNPTTSTMFYKFTIHSLYPLQSNPVQPSTPPITSPLEYDFISSFPDPTTSLGVLGGNPVFWDWSVGEILPHSSTAVSVGDDFNNNGRTFIFPETAQRVYLRLPKLHQDNFPDGFIIMMSPVGDDALIHGLTDGKNVNTYKAAWKFNDVYPNFCNTSPLPSCLQDTANICNPYTSRCQPATPAALPNQHSFVTSPLIDPTSKSCLLKCPGLMEANTACTQCICKDDTCRQFTRSVQVSLAPMIDNEAYTVWLKNSLIRSYLTSHLSISLGLNGIPTANIATGGKSYYGIPPHSVEGVAQDNRVIPFASESLFISFLNPTMTQYYDYSTVLITFSINVIATSNKYEVVQRASRRFDMFVERLSKIVGTNAAPPGAYLTRDKHPLLPPNWSIQFIPTTTPSLISITSNTTEVLSPTLILSKQATLCAGNNVTTPKGTCPLPVTSLLSKSDYWSRCDNSNPALTSQYLSPRCYDYLGNEVKPPQKGPEGSKHWCAQGWHNYPIVTTAVSCNPIDISRLPSKIQFDTGMLNGMNAGGVYTLKWLWPDTNPQFWTVDIYFGSNEGTYSKYMATTPAINRQIDIKIPTLFSTQTVGYFIIRCTNYALLKSDKHTFDAYGANHCPTGNVCDKHPGQKCNIVDNSCNCLPGWEKIIPKPLWATEPICQPICTSHCSKNYCTEDVPDACSACDDSGMTGPLCDIKVDCGNNKAADGINSNRCLNRGFVDLVAGKTCAESKCKCKDYWGGDDCSVCNLMEGTNLPIISQCIPTHTNSTLTKASSSLGGKDCQKCHCLPGFYGELCQHSAIRGGIVFKTTPQPTPFEMSQTSEDPQGFHFVTADGREVLVSDVAQTLGIDQKYVSITLITQATDTSSSTFQLQATPTSTTVNYAIQPSSTSGLNSLDDLASLWNSLSTNLPSTPIGVTEASGEVGQASSVNNAQKPEPSDGTTDPLCPEGKICDCDAAIKLQNGGYCPDPIDPSNASKSSATPIIIGVVVGAGGVIALFAVTIVVVKWAKKNEKLCFVPDKKSGQKGSKASGGKSQYDSSHLELEASVDPSTLSRSSALSATTAKSGKSTSSTAVDLVEITDHGEHLPDGWSKQKHNVTGDEFYVFIKDGEMKSQRHSPLDKDDCNGTGW